MDGFIVENSCYAWKQYNLCFTLSHLYITQNT